MKTPRLHQVRAAEAIRDSARRGHKRILAVSPTGSGKMFIGAMLMQAAHAKGKYAAYLADQRELVGHCERELKELLVQFGTIMAETDNTYHSARVQVISKDTLWARRRKKDLPRADLVVFDEAHKSLASTWQSIAEEYANSVVVGFTATPCRTDGRGLGDFYTDMIQVATYKELQQANLLVPTRVFAPSRPDLKGIKSSAGDYAKKPLESRMNQDALVGNIVEDWRARASDRITVAFASGIAHSIHIRNEFRRAGIPAEHLDGGTDTSEREDILGRLADGRISVCCNYGVLTTGVDVPILKCAICARPTKSFSLWRQMCGRLARPFGGFSNAIVLDHSGAVFTHGFPDEDVEWILETSERIQDRVAKKNKEKGVKDPYCCEQCKTVYRGPHCPMCGHKPERREKKVTMTKGELEEVERAKANKEATLADKQKFWDDCMGQMIGQGRKIGAAAHRYKQRFGVFPPSQLSRVPRGSEQWNMDAREFYAKHVAPKKVSA